MTEHWIIDAPPLILLGKSGQLEWLPHMGRVIVPESVALEIAAGAIDDPAHQWLESPGEQALISSTVIRIPTADFIFPLHAPVRP